MQRRFCLSLPEKISNKIDLERGDVTRSRYITRLIEKALEMEGNKD